MTVSEKPTTRQAHTRCEHDLTELQRRRNVTDAGENLFEKAVLLAVEPGLLDTEQKQCNNHGDEARRIEHRDRSPSRSGVDRGTDERSQQTEPFPDRLRKGRSPRPRAPAGARPS